MSLFSGWLIAYGAHMTKGTCYEEIAMMSFGPKAQKFTCLCMISCNIGFTVSYIVLFKSFMPYAIATTSGQALPHWCDDSRLGQAFWGVIFCTVVVFPLSIPRQLTALRYTSAFSVLVSFYIVLVIFFCGILNKGTTTSVSEGFKLGREEK